MDLHLEVCAKYRQLHQIPECSGQEEKTSLFIYNALKAFGYAPQRIGQQGVLCDLVQEDHLPYILFRADMDALHIEEQTDLPFKSTHQGVMHACGHDAHVAMLLTAAQYLKHTKCPLNIRFLFQPKEEIIQGAQEMIACGALDKDILSSFAFHVWPNIEKGVVKASRDYMMASSDVFRIVYKGVSAHCAMRDKGKDALQSAVMLYSKFEQLEQLGEQKCILFCGELSGGKSHNVVPDEAQMYGTLRTHSFRDREKIKEALLIEAKKCAELHGTQVQFSWESGVPPVKNTPQVVRVLEHLLPASDVDSEVSFAAEDFACYLEHTKGAFCYLGTGKSTPLHANTFYVEDEVLKQGVQAWIKIATYDWRHI